MPEPGEGAGRHQRISSGQRESLLDAALAGIRRLLRSAEALSREALSPDAVDPDGLLAVAGGLYTYAVEEYSKALLIESLPEKSGVISVPYREIFRSHGKTFEAARGALPRECWSAEDGYIDPAYFDTGTALNATFPTRMSTLYLDMDRNGRPVESIPPTAQLLEGALAGMERGVGEWEARGRSDAADAGEARSGRGVA